jgi:hypothetical protein
VTVNAATVDHCAGRKQPAEQQHGERAEYADHGQAQGAPAGKRDRHTQLTADEAQADEVRRRADRCRQSADRGGEGDAQVEAGGERRRRPRRRIGRLLDRCHEAGDDRHHQRRRHGVGDEGARQHRHDRHGGEQPARPLSDPGHGEHGVGQPAVEPLDAERLGEQKRADEQEDERIGERPKHLLGGRHPEEHAGSGPDERRHGQRQRLGEPEHDHDRDDPGQRPGFGGELHAATPFRSVQPAAGHEP